jgi:hypothetical protein
MKIYYGNRFEHVQWIKLAQNCSVKLRGNILKLTQNPGLLTVWLCL